MTMEITITEKDLENGFKKWLDKLKENKGKFIGDGTNPALHAGCLWAYLTANGSGDG